MASAPQSSSIVRIGVLGCGNVGAAFIQLVERQADVIEARTGVRLQIARVAVRNVSRDREVQLPDGVVTRDAESVVKDPTVDLIVEVIGGIEPARELIATAIANGKPV
ncbi:MAG: homoserine dehydrogenase, partial [Actinobacteria bacterium]|nr:homoserine dehydrogenase [Actinomycetota bacterium]MSZ95858.1 homoserine dehydrogenase [Actinomycetota bacterium]